MCHRAPTRLLREPRWALLVAVACGGVTGALGAHYWRGRRSGWIDQLLGAPVRAALAGWHPTLWAVVSLGSPGLLGVLCLLIAAAAIWRRRWDLAAVILVAPPLASITTEWLLKPLVGRTIAVGWCYPSGHMTGITAAAAALFLINRNPLVPTPRRVAVAVLVTVVPLAMAVSLVGLGVHYPTDTIGGGCLALAITLLVAALHDGCSGVVRRARRRQSPNLAPR
jgi:undecaprenyl-diphosphatase